MKDRILTASPAFRLQRKRTRGASLLMVVAIMVVMVGIAAIALDAGLMATNANRLQRGCDAGALAGAAKLDFVRSNFAINNNNGTTSTVTVTTASQTAAKNDAVFVAGLNGVTALTSQVTFPTIYRVCVSVPESSALFFARIFGIQSSTITRRATAEKKPVAGIGGAAPLGLTVDDYNNYKPSAGSSQGSSITLDLIVNQSEDFTPGDILALSLDNNPSKPVGTFQDEVTNGYTPITSVGQTVNSLNGTTSVQNATYDALTTRMQQGRTIFPVTIIPPKNQTNGTSYFVGNLTFVELLNVSAPAPGRNGHPARITLRFVTLPGLDVSKYPVDMSDTSNISDIYVLRLVDDL